LCNAQGNLGSITADANGAATGTLLSATVDLFWRNSIVGRALTLSAGANDCANSTSIAAAVVAQSVIGIARNFDPAFDGTNNETPASPSTVLLATMQPTTGNAAVNGSVWFRPSALQSGRVEVYARFAGCEPGKLYGFHIHNYGDWSNADGTSAGAHWTNNPNAVHALPDEWWVTRLAGEMGNVLCSSDGQIYFNRHFDLILLGGKQIDTIHEIKLYL
jgi:Cu/Zn superoxide dismutase